MGVQFRWNKQFVKKQIKQYLTIDFVLRKISISMVLNFMLFAPLMAFFKVLICRRLLFMKYIIYKI